MEPYPIAVTKSRFPTMKHLGDISKISGAEIEPVDIITFGSPCQDLSNAGLRKGLKHTASGDEETTRSGLFIEAVRIIKEMREATNGKYPTYALWENVPGAFTSNRGEDFRVVLEELIKVVEPSAVMPDVPPFGWPYADSHSGDGWSIAYRVFDAQYWGVPQRRRRIHLVADFRGQSARKVLFEREGLRGHLGPSRTPWQDDSAGAQGSSGANCREQTVTETYLIGSIGGQSEYSKAADVHGTLVASQLGAVAYRLAEPLPEELHEFVQDNNKTAPHQQDRLQTTDGIAYTLTCAGPDHTKPVIYDGKGCVVRRLTPTECARLQGFADRWGDITEKVNLTDEEHRFWLAVRNTHAAINGRVAKDYTKEQILAWYNKLHTDTAEYKMWGNGIALPPALYCLQGMVEVLQEINH